jgi:hypothetical protein
MGAARPRPRGRHESKRAARVVFAGLCLLLLGVSFGLGMLAGRQWAGRGVAGVEASRPGNGAREAGGRGESAAGRRGRSVASEPVYPQIQDKLTFYQTLPAPLGGEIQEGERPGRRDGKADKAPAPRSESKPPEPKAPESKPDGRRGSGPESSAPVPSGVAAAYTVQVAAYRSRAQAESLRQALGQDAYVVEAVAESGTTYRVRLGAYTTRAEAEAAAARVRAERAVATFITTR